MPYLSNYAAVGDPGFFGAIGRALKGGAVGLLTGGPVGAVMGAAGGLAGVPGAGLPGTTAQIMSGQTARYVPGRIVQSRQTYQPGLGLPPFNQPQQRMALPYAGQQAVGQMAAQAQMVGGCPKGYRPNKSSYYTREGFVPKGSRCVKYRYRNNANGRALKRAISRAKAFDGMVKKNRKTLRSLASI